MNKYYLQENNIQDKIQDRLSFRGQKVICDQFHNEFSILFLVGIIKLNILAVILMVSPKSSNFKVGIKFSFNIDQKLSNFEPSFERNRMQIAKF